MLTPAWWHRSLQWGRQITPGWGFGRWVCAHLSFFLTFLTIEVFNSAMGHLTSPMGLTWVLWDHPALGAGTLSIRKEEM